MNIKNSQEEFTTLLESRCDMNRKYVDVTKMNEVIQMWIQEVQ